MQLKWPNLFGFALALFAAVLAVRFHREVSITVGSISAIGPGHTLEEKTLGLAVLGLILVVLVAVVRIVCRNNGKDDQ